MFRGLVARLPFALIALAVSGCSGGGTALSTVPASTSGNYSVSHEAPVVANAARKSSANVSASGGTVGLNDDFSEDTIGGPAAGWNVVSGSWSVCQAAGAHAYCQSSKGYTMSLNGASSWRDYTIEAQLTDPSLTSGATGIIGRATGADRYYQLELKPSGSAPYWYLKKRNGTSTTVLASGPLKPPDINPHYRLRLAFAGSQIAASIAFDGGTSYQSLTTVTDSSYATGMIGVSTWDAAADSFSSVLVTLAEATLPSESAVSSNAFVDSLGMNAHFESPVYYKHYTQVRSLIANLGIHHYRVSAGNILATGGYSSDLADLYGSFGVTFNVLSDLHTSPAQVVKAVGLLPSGSVNSVEGPNETDNPGQGMYYDPHFATDVPAYMQSLYTTIKSTPATSQLSIIGPSFVNATSYSAIGNIANYVDTGNMHNYFAGFNPGTSGWGGSGYSFAPHLNYGSIDWNIAASGQATGSKPVVTTETGYDTAAIHGGVPFDVQAKYVPRMYFEQYRHRVPSTFMYQLIGYDTTTADGTLDIVSPNYVPSPAYNALAGMIALLNDGGVKSAPVNYNWGLAGQTGNVHHVLLHKADGTLIIPLWIEVPSFDPNANGGRGAEISVAEQTVKVRVTQTTGSGVLWTCTPSTGAWSSTSLTIANGSVTIKVGDSVSILEISPS